MSRRFDTLDEWLAWQESLHPRSIDLGLDRVRAVAAALGVETVECPVITVAGTNGKGSSVALLESILSAAGRRVGTLTSPHLHAYNERIRVAGRLADDLELMDAFESIDRARGRISLTFFEFNTLAALLVFRRQPLDALVLEVGLGGRLDAVNIVDADAALLTSVAFDHMEWLGSTLEDIGREKAGIFRRGRPAILGSARLPGSVAGTARAMGADLRMPPGDFHYEILSDRWNWRGRHARFDGLPFPALIGAHQLDNAAAVLAVLEALGARFMVNADAVAAGLERVRLNGRFEVIPGRPEWILDVAHNPAAAEQLAATLAQRPCAGRTIAIVGILRDKDVAGVIAPLRPLVDQWIAADLPGPRGMSGAALQAAGGADGSEKWSTAAGVAEACERAARVAGAADRVLVFGSFYTVGPALAWRHERDSAQARGRG